MDKTSRIKNTVNVVLIADLINENNSLQQDARRDLEKSEQKTINQLIATIHQLGRGVVHYQSPDELAKNALLHKGDIVLSIYGGEVSRNRMALVPAICETFGLQYIGPDVYGRVVAQDKEVSKRLAIDAGLQTPQWRIIRQEEDVVHLNSFDFPCVIKPLMEGSSIGISQSSLSYTIEQATLLINKLLTDLDQPIIAEHFIPGRETALSVIERKDGFHWAYSEIVIDNDPDFFQNRLFDAEEKINPTQGRTVRNIDEELNQADLEKISALLKSFGHFGYCRVDGRHSDGRFYFLEMTPDAWIDKKGQFAMAFTEKGWPYAKVINELLLSKEQALPDQLTNG